MIPKTYRRNSLRKRKQSKGITPEQLEMLQGLLETLKEEVEKPKDLETLRAELQERISKAEGIINEARLSDRNNYSNYMQVASVAHDIVNRFNEENETDFKLGEVYMDTQYNEIRIKLKGGN